MKKPPSEDSLDEDPIVEEVRRIREEIGAEFDFDLKRIAEHVKEFTRNWRESLKRSK